MDTWQVWGRDMCRSEGRDRLEELSGREKDNIKTDLKDVGWEDVAWTDEAQDRNMWQAVVSALTNIKRK